MPAIIESVSNYCHRWCERCPFTDRCGLIAHEREFMPKEMQQEIIPLPNAFPAMSGVFSDFLRRLEVQLQQNGSTLAEMGYGVGEEMPRPSGLHPSAQSKLAMDLAVGAMKDLRETSWMPDIYKGADFSDAGVQAAKEFSWYSIMIGPKFRRCVPDEDMTVWNDVANGVDLDAARTARLTHLIFTRTIAAITVLLEQYGPPAWEDLQLTLEGSLRLLAALRSMHPLVHEFRRPGFDDPAERKNLEAFYDGSPPIDPFVDGSWSRGGRAPVE